MIDVLISGRLYGTPSVHTSADGKTFARFRVSASDRNGESQLCSCTTVSDSALADVQRLSAGDGITISGDATPSIWKAGNGADWHGLDGTVRVVKTPRTRHCAELDRTTAGGQ